MLSGYNLMWMMVMFDLPVQTHVERKRATDFRNLLLNMGFEMAQYSVYFRFCGDRQKTKPFVNMVKKQLPREGKVSILFFTDKQFAETINYANHKRKLNNKKPDQLCLF
jgi:CRISPR-associated protein Cas2